MRAATQVTAPIPTASNVSANETSPADSVPAAHRAGTAMGEVNGISDRTTASLEPGSFNIPSIPKNESIRSQVTGCCAWRASWSVDEIAPTAAYMDE